MCDIEAPETEPPPYVVFLWRSESDGKWRWHAKARNGEIICTPGQGFKQKESAIHSINLIFNQLAHIPHEETEDPNA